MIYHVSYISRANQRLSDRDLKALAAQAADKNDLLGITGFLVYDGFHFFQYIEGPKDYLNLLYQKIKKDPRHSGVTTLSEGPAPERFFPNWGMRSFLPSDFVAADRVHIIDILSHKHEKEAISKIIKDLQIRQQTA